MPKITCIRLHVYGEGSYTLLEEAPNMHHWIMMEGRIKINPNVATTFCCFYFLLPLLSVPLVAPVAGTRRRSRRLKHLYSYLLNSMSQGTSSGNINVSLKCLSSFAWGKRISLINPHFPSFIRLKSHSGIGAFLSQGSFTSCIISMAF